MVFMTMKTSTAESGFFSDASPFNPEFYILSQVLLSIAVTKDSAAALPKILIQIPNQEPKHLMLSTLVGHAVAGDLRMKMLVLRPQCACSTRFRGSRCYFRLPLIWCGLNAHSLVVGGMSFTSD